MARSRIRVGAIFISSVAGALSGLVGAGYTGKWPWGIVVGVVVLVALAAGAKAMGAWHEQKDAGRGPDEDNRIDGESFIAVGGNFSSDNSVIAARDVNQSKVTNIRSGNTTPLLLAALCLALLAGGAGGTLIMGHGPDGARVSGSRSGGNPDRRPVASPQASPGHSAGNASGSAMAYRAATFTETDSTGDSVTQALWFEKPFPLSRMPSLAPMAQTACTDTPVTDPSGRDLVVPFIIVSRLNSTVAAQASVTLSVGDFVPSSPANYDGGLDPSTEQNVIVLGNFQGGIACDAAGASGNYSGGGTVTVDRKGAFVAFSGWLIFRNAVTANNPDGNMSALGQTYVQLSVGNGYGTAFDTLRASGPGVCSGLNSGIGNLDGASPPFIHIGGPVHSWEGCSGSYSGSAGPYS